MQHNEASLVWFGLVNAHVFQCKQYTHPLQPVHRGLKALASPPVSLHCLGCDASAWKISNIREANTNRRRPSLPGQKNKKGGLVIVFSDVLLPPPFPTVTVTEAFWDRLWPRLAGLGGVSAVSPGTSWHRVPTRNAAAAA